MAGYEGYLIKVGGASGTAIPMEYIGIESYDCSPNQRMESKAARNVEGYLQRTTVAHTATKIEFSTPVLTNAQVAHLVGIFKSHFTNLAERKVEIWYYDMESNGYTAAVCYMPDAKYTINHIDSATNTVYYNPIRYAFIEY